MPGYFLDSSAIGKQYHFELGTLVIQELFSQRGGNLYVSRLSAVEVPSAFAGKVRTGHLSGDDLRLLVDRFRIDLRRKTLKMIGLKAGHFREAERLIDLHGVNDRLRSLDAIHLSVAIDLRKRALVDIFVCSDKSLCRVAEVVGFKVLNPESTLQP